ncbi:sulfite exporter TauE/SafE family protein [Candidatus Peregrinibacteria bacterium]|nr:MAG: sulfite exporter TauE/SafE family protein [Candidatus Peregrinibacteria bacterium]
MNSPITLGIAFTAGLVSFLSPCVLPLIPGFLSHLGGSTLSDAKIKRWSIFLSSVFFVLGFSTFFALIGVLLNTVLSQWGTEVQSWVARLGGAFIILFGLFLTGILTPTFLQKEYKFKPRLHPASRHFSAFLFGAAFAAGWTPCVGPVLGSILVLATVSPSSSFALLLTYSFGMGLPFLLVGLFASPAANLIRRYRMALQGVTVIFGILLIALGILVFTERLDLFFASF